LINILNELEEKKNLQ